MARYIGPACKLCRREGEKLFLKGARCFSPKCAFEQRGFAPGQHGRTSQGAAVNASRIMPANCAPSSVPAGCMAFSNDNSVAISLLHSTAAV